MTDYTITSRDPRVLDAVRDFLTGNGIDPRDVPRYSTITVEDDRLTTDRYLRDEDGRLARVGGQPVIETVAVDLVVPWPADLVLHPLCVVEEDGAPCPYLAVGATMRCLQHAEPAKGDTYHGKYLTPAHAWTTGIVEPPPAPIPARPYSEDRGMVELGAELDHVDFAEAHGEIRPELAAALLAAAEDQLTGIVTTTAPSRAEPVTLDDIADLVETIDKSTPYQRRYAMPGPVRFNGELSEGERADFLRRFEKARMDTRLRVVEPRYTERHTTDQGGRAASEPQRSLGGRIWRRLRRWSR
ncbi:hypothetical protein ACFORH_42700 [Amycolatopsis roodepoortensis]|uniref:Uncharacterized protein n=1 Tax=Amycolatopsis roodepoortensis TaxID=700274 RepID=A0ABR9L3B3_9PSEU|nr:MULTISPECIES: hypothetical protein [Amycolatopsis]MBE1575046.1 hypothetical protein [Amycolatopsis roodepoortensis]GHG97309.1 hypothetical protein GCM10017788_76730 [Amycolatopsis acidiphila]